MGSNEAAERLQSELDLLDAMYAGQCEYSDAPRELIFHMSRGAVLKISLPKEYLADESTSPEIISATVSSESKQDVRALLNSKMSDANLTPGNESLDAIVGLFNELVEEAQGDETPEPAPTESSSSERSVSNNPNTSYMTVIIWLHHLLATSKRKAALSPPSGTATGGAVSGISKPGYPGVMIFSGPESLVREHVKDLRGMKWQAFQIRLEEVHDGSQVWQFEHGEGVTELEAMGDVVKDIIGEENKDTIVKALGIR